MVESVVFSGSVLIVLMGIGVGEIGGGNVVVVLDWVDGGNGPTNSGCDLVMEHSKLQIPQQTLMRGVQ